MASAGPTTAVLIPTLGLLRFGSSLGVNIDPPSVCSGARPAPVPLERKGSLLRRSSVARRASAAALTAIALVIAACGSAETEPEAAPAPEAPAPEAPAPAEVPFPNIVDGVLQPLESGFPSEPITLWQAFEPGSGDDVFNQFVAEVAADYSPVPIRTNTQQMGPAQTYELSEYLRTQVAGAEDGYHIFATSFFGQGVRLFTQSALADVPADDLFARLNPINRMTFAPYAFYTRLDSELKTMDDVIAAMKASPGTINLSSSSPGGGIPTSTSVWAAQEGVEYNYVPTGSPDEALQVLLGGGSEVATSRGTPGLDDQFNVLMVTGDARLPAYPDTPSAGELGYDIPAGTDRGYAAVADVPQEHLDWIFELMRLVSEDERFQERFADFNLNYIDGEAVNAARYTVVREFLPVLLDLGGIVVREDAPTLP